MRKLIALVVLIGCGSPSAARYQAQKASLREQAESQFWVPSCEQKPEGSLYQCGMLADGDLEGVSFEAFAARCSLRYGAADVTRVQTWCTAYPDACTDFRQLELAYMQSHDETIQARYDLHNYDLTEKISTAERKHAARIGAAVASSFSQAGPNPRPLSQCTTIEEEGVAETYCH